MLWIYPPDWQTPILERLEWKTDVIANYDGSEQRIALRQLPRCSLEFAVLIDGDQQRRGLEAKLWANGAKAWGVPIWTETTYTTADITTGSNIVPVNTTHFCFAVGKKIMLRSCTGRYQLAEIASISTHSITLTQNLSEAWDVETAIIPVRTGYLDTSQQITRFKGDAVYDTVRFEFDDWDEVAPEIAQNYYRGHAVLAQVSDWQQDLTLQYQRKMQVLEFESGKFRDDETGQPVLVHSHHWVLDGREKIDQFLKFLYARRGRLSACWLPSFLNDLQIVNPIANGSAQINIEACDYTDLYQLKKNRRDIRIELTDGNVLYRRIIASNQTLNVEHLTLDVPIPQEIAVDDVVRISFMTFSRLATDSIDLSWSWSDFVNVSANWVSTNDDI